MGVPDVDFGAVALTLIGHMRGGIFVAGDTLIVQRPLGRRGSGPRSGRPTGHRSARFWNVAFSAARRDHSSGVPASTRQPDQQRRLTVAALPVEDDRTEGRPWDDKVFRRGETAGGAPVTVWGM